MINIKRPTPKQEFLKANIDWLQFRIDDLSIEAIMDFFEIPQDMFLFQVDHLAGYKHFQHSYEFQGIKLYFGIYEDEFEIRHSSTMTWVSGTGCRYLENIIFKKKGCNDWREFFEELISNLDTNEHPIDFRRVDLNIDDFNDVPYFTPEQLLKYCETNRFRYGRSQSYSPQGTMKLGMTLYLGASKSDRRIRIYDKEKEQQKKEKYVVRPWIRTEIQFMRDIADISIRQYVKSNKSLMDFTKGYLKEQLHFYTHKEWKKEHKPLETRKWTRFLGNSEPFELPISRTKSNMQEKIEWLITGGGLAILKAYDLLHQNNILPIDLDDEYKNGVPDLIMEKDYTLELSKVLINHVSTSNISNQLKQKLIEEIKEHTYDPFRSVKLMKRRIYKIKS